MWPFVSSTDADTKHLGVGKLISDDGLMSTIKYFDSPKKSHQIKVFSECVEQVPLQIQTRVYFDHPEEGWKIGRVMEGDGNDEHNIVTIRFPG